MPGLEDLYKEIILDHYKSPRNKGELETPPASKTEGFNPLCGDEIVLYLQVDDDTITDVKISGQGCSISQSSASMMTAAIKGKTIQQVQEKIDLFKTMISIHESSIQEDSNSESEEELKQFKLGDLEALRGVVKFPVRIKCAVLAWTTLEEALKAT